MIDEEDDQPQQNEQQTRNRAGQQHEQLDPELPQEALEKLQAYVCGNGIKPESVRLHKCVGETLTFEAQEIFQIVTAISERRTTGRENGEKAGSPQDAQQKIQAAVDRLTRDRDVHKLTVSLLKKRKDSGFAIDGQIIPLTRYNKSYVIHEPCGPCDSSGKTLCQNCRGKRVIVCVKCHGQRDIQCHTCNGAQFINTPQGRQQCTLCYGKGRTGCDLCQQTGEVTCPKCRNTGKMPCQNCGATGWHSHTYLMDVKAKSRFAYDAEALPEEIPPLIDEYGPRLVTEGHARARIIEDVQRQQQLEKITQKGEYVVPYDVRLPWGDIDFDINGKRLSGKLFGYNPTLLELPDFIEKIIGGALRLVGEAGAGKGNVAANIGKATRYRTIGDAFLITARTSPKQAAVALQARHPVGFAPQTLAKLCHDAKLAMKNVTRKPRLIGLAAGAVIASALYAGYFFSQLRLKVIDSAVMITLPEILSDISVFLLGALIITTSGQIGATQALKKALGKLMKRGNATTGKIAPKIGQTALIAAPAAILLFMAVTYLAAANGQISPDWYRQIFG